MLLLWKVILLFYFYAYSLATPLIEEVNGTSESFILHQDPEHCSKKCQTCLVEKQSRSIADNLLLTGNVRVCDENELYQNT